MFKLFLFYSCKISFYPAVHYLTFVLIISGSEIIHICSYFILFGLDHLFSLSQMIWEFQFSQNSDLFFLFSGWF